MASFPFPFPFAIPVFYHLHQMWNAERKGESLPCLCHSWPQESHGHSHPLCFIIPLMQLILLEELPFSQAKRVPSHPCHSGNMNVDAYGKQVNTWSTEGRVCVWISGPWLKRQTLKSSKWEGIWILHRPKCNFHLHPLSFNKSWWHDSCKQLCGQC